MAVRLKKVAESAKHQSWRYFLTVDQSWSYFTIDHKDMAVPEGRERLKPTTISLKQN
jgi:hypothetical protein